jgi:uncharacterized protein
MVKAPSSHNSSITWPVFPRFTPLLLAHREIFRKILWDYQPETSELTFSNLYMWQSHYHYQWSRHQDWLLVVSASPIGAAWALPPIGPPPRADLCRLILTWLRESRGVADPAIERADPRLVAELSGHPDFSVEPIRDHFDYVYRAQDLIQLPGGPYRAKRNHVNSLTRSGGYRYEPLQPEHLAACLELSGRWCDIKRCDLDLSLLGEWEAINAALADFQVLQLQGAVLLIDDRVEAFTCGELLSRQTAVIHLEKANPEVRGLYAVINQEFCRQAWAGVPFINREQDLGEAGLRAAKMSYHPHRLVEKFRIRLA